MLEPGTLSLRSRQLELVRELNFISILTRRLSHLWAIESDAMQGGTWTSLPWLAHTLRWGDDHHRSWHSSAQHEAEAQKP